MTSSHQENTEALISKKEILEAFDISYGQFYRWKRKGLIPESWFIRKSTFTGQESFLPRDKITDRISTIVKLKAQHSLEEIAELLTPESTQKEFDADELTHGVVSSETLHMFSDLTGHTGPFPFHDVVRMNIFKELNQLSLATDEVKLALETFDQNEAGPDEAEIDWTLWIIRKKNKLSLCCVAPRSKIKFDAETEIIADIDLASLMESTKLSLRGI